MGRKLRTEQYIDDPAQNIVLSEMVYNEIGQLKEKRVHSEDDGGTFLNTESYAYNPRGWLKQQSGPRFSLQLKYEDGTNPQYNGNIADQYWGPSSNVILHNYSYLYDRLNRLTKGISDEGFNETIDYDKMGNIIGLTRNPMGNSNYSYSGNRLTGISGALNSSYGYDANGNQTSDSGKGITIAYNYLNLPQTIVKASTSETMTNYWLATGAKIKKTVGGMTREYAGGIEYSNGIVDFIQTEEGRAIPLGGGNYSYEYMLRDHLGNTRVLLKEDGSVLETSDYYPFGLQVSRSGQTVPSPENRYKYNGKELQTELGLGQYDYGARFYDPGVGRLTTIDPKTELYFQISTYAYAANTPVNAIDPDGKLVIFINGNHFGNGGSRDYWSTLARNMPNSPSASGYNKYRFDEAVMDRIGDRHAMYVDGAGNKMKGFHPFSTFLSPGLSGVSASDRRDAGYEEGMTSAAAIIESLHRTGGVINESIKIITHSMGGAYGKGYAQAILDYARQHKIAGVEIAFEADFAPFQPGKQKAVKGVPTLQFSHEDDMIAGDDQMPGAKKMDTSSDKQQGHSIFGFADQVKNLPAGKYKIVNGRIVPE